MEWSLHPINLALRFGLEIVALYAMSSRVYAMYSSPENWFYAILSAVLAGAIWTIFKVPGDKSSNGKAIVPINGVLRFLIEFSFFFVAVFLLIVDESYSFAGIFGFFIFMHYLTSLDRFVWLLKN